LADNQMTLYNKWSQTKSKEDFQSLYETMKDTIEISSRKAAMGSNVPQSAHKIWAAQIFLDSLKTYNPNMDTQLKTHVSNAIMRKANRLNYTYQDLGSKSEQRATKVGLFQAENANLINELGREPSAAELADRTHLGIRDIERLQKELHKNLSTNIGIDSQIGVETTFSEEVLSYIYYELNNEQKVVYEYIYGRNGKPRLVKTNGKVDFDEIASRSRMSKSKVYRLVKEIEIILESRLKNAPSRNAP
jgi:DNA-directed RNA polymerase specialized sigma subunit